MSEKGRSVPDGWPPRRGSGNFRLSKQKQMRLGIVGAVVVFLFLVTFLMSRGGGVGLVNVSTSEVAVVVTYMSGNIEVKDKPGFLIVLPFLQRAYKFDREPIQFVMEGASDRDANHVRQLNVRANDGSGFWFDRVEIQYRLNPALVKTVLEDSGPGEAFKLNWVKAYARSILRDEFGKYSAEEAADPSSYVEATRLSKQKLNDLLAPHGLEIIQIVTPRPKFNDAYEKAIEDRKVADQEVQRLKEQASQKLVERERLLQAVERDMNTAYEELKGELRGQELAAQRDAIEQKRTSDAFKIRETKEGEAVRDAMIAEARGLESQARKEAEGLRARVDALAERGEILVREALASKLAGITFTVVPYRRDPAPLRIEHLGGAVVPKKGEDQ